MDFNVINELLGDKVDNICWLSHFSGMARIVNIDTLSRDHRVLNNKVPISCRTSYDECVKGRYMDLLPSDDKASILFFHPEGKLKFTHNYLKVNVKMVLWVNLPKLGIDNDCNLFYPFLSDILNVIPEIKNTENYESVELSFIDADDPKQSYNYWNSFNWKGLDIRRFFLYPYFTLTANFSLSFTVKSDCLPKIQCKEEILCVKY